MATQDITTSPSQDSLDPNDISNRQFKKSMFGGFKRRVVQSYLKDVGDQVKSLLDVRASLESQVAEQQADLEQLRQRAGEQQDQLDKQKRRIEQQEKKLAEFRQAEQSLRSALVSSQKFAEDLLETSRREADSIVESARLEKARVRLEAKELSISLTKEVRAMQEQRQRLYAELGAILDTHRNLLENYTAVQAVDIALPEPGEEQKTLSFSEGKEPPQEPAAPFMEGYEDDEEEEEWTATPEVMPEGQPLSAFGDFPDDETTGVPDLGEESRTV